MGVASLFSAIDELSAAERRVAEVVLAAPDEVTRLSVRDLATRADVSEPTVIRFCRSLGCDGFTDFKLRLAEHLAVRPVTPLADVERSDGPSAVVAKVFQGAERALHSARDSLDVAQVDAAAKIIAKAKNLWFFGYGASGVVASDARQKFVRLGIPCGAEQDPHNQLVVAANLGSKDVVVLISHTGRSEDLLGVIDEARRAGATTLALTRARTPVAERSDHVVEVWTDEDTGIYTPGKSRTVHLTVLDAIATLVALRQGSSFTARQGAAKEALRRARTSETPSTSKRTG